MSRLYLYGGVAVLFVILGIYTWGLSNSLELSQDRLAQAEARATVLAADLAAERYEIVRVNEILDSLESKEAEVRTVEKVITKEIVKYRDRDVIRCQLSDDWLCIHNASAQGSPADCSPGQIQNDS